MNLKTSRSRGSVDGQALSKAFEPAFWSLPAKLVRQAKSRNLNAENLFEPWTLATADYAMKLPPDAMGKGLTAFTEIEAQGDAFMASYDAWLTPVLASPPVRLGELAPPVDFKTLAERLTHYARLYTAIHNVAGTPAMSVPLAMGHDGLPSAANSPLPRDARTCSTHSLKSWKPRNPGRRARRKSGWDDASDVPGGRFRQGELGRGRLGGS